MLTQMEWLAVRLVENGHIGKNLMLGTLSLRVTGTPFTSLTTTYTRNAEGVTALTKGTKSFITPIWSGVTDKTESTN